jgi:hypothetical protein
VCTIEWAGVCRRFEGQSQDQCQRSIRSLVQVPVLLIMFSGMWLATTLGFTRQTFRFLGRGMQSRRLKARAFKDYQPTSRDVFVCTYDKSGTNLAGPA